jgi:hypothetical protein
MKVKINQAKINQALLKNPKMIKFIRDEIYSLAEEYAEKNKQEMLNEFDNHPVTKEIENGPDASNISNTLAGEGNLFSYIGFNEGDNPTEVVRDILNNSVKVDSRAKISADSKGLKINFPISAPTLSEIESQTPMPFEGGRSWVRGIEKGISGFSNYIFRKFIQGSRSGTGIQTESEVRTGSFKPTSYMKQILNKFYLKINAKINA